MTGRPLVLDWQETAEELQGAYRHEAIAEVRRHRRGGRQGRAAKLTAEQEQALRARAAAGAFRTAAEVRQWVAATCAVDYTADSIYRLLWRLRIHPKVPRPQAGNASPEAQAAWKKGAARRP